jgi:hypothetical protein
VIKKKMIYLKSRRPLFSVFLILVSAFLVFACSPPSWFPIKKGPSSQAKPKDLMDKEIVIIDKQEYVKVLNPKASEEGTQSKYLYIPLREYLTKKEGFVLPRREEPRKEPAGTPHLPASTPAVGEQFSVSPPKPAASGLKNKVVMAYFDDRALPQADETYGDWIASKLIKEVDRRSQKALFIDYPMVREFLEARGISPADFEKPEVLRLLNEVFGIQALIFGHLTGPYTFVTKGEKDPEGTASAIIKIEMKLVETLTGKILKNLEASNPILTTKTKGSFPEEKAKVKAIEVTLVNLGSPLSREIDGLDWFCRIAKIDGEAIYLNAGRLTGVKEGDVLEIQPPGKPGGRPEVKGRIRISSCFGMDASIGNLIQGEKPEQDDILRYGKSNRTPS